MQNLDAAAALCDAAARRGADPGDVLLIRGLIAAGRGALDQAAQLLAQGCSLRPQSFDLWFNLGLVHLRSGSAVEAIRYLAKAIALDPKRIAAHIALGDARRAARDLPGAEQCYRAALALDENTHARLALARVLAGAGNIPEARANFERVLEREPGNFSALFNLAHLLASNGLFAEAVPYYRRASALQPTKRAALVQLGEALRRTGHLDESLRVLQRVVQEQEDTPLAQLNLGNTLRDLGRYREALDHYARAMEIAPTDAHGYYNCGNTLLDVGERERGLRFLRQAVALNPSMAAARVSLAVGSIPRVADDASDMASGREQFLSEVASLRAWSAAHPEVDAEKIVGIDHPFALAYQDESNVDLLRPFGTLCAELMGAWQRRHAIVPGARPGSPPARIRVGIVSAHLYDHSVFNAIIRGWLKHLDPDRFDIRLFYLAGHSDAQTEFARSQATFFDCEPRDTLGWARAIAEHANDILIYPEVSMNSMTVKLASLRLAPVQAAAWGHPETTGIPTIDHFLSAADFEPPDSARFYSENLVALPNLGCCYEPVRTAEPCDAAALGIDCERPILLCAGSALKYTPVHDALLVEIARREPRSQFIFFHDKKHDPYLIDLVLRRIAGEFARAGLTPGAHLRMVPWQSPGSFLGLMQQADVLLDTIGFSGFNTAMQAVESGLPIVAYEGRFMRGRLASAIVRRLGLDELVARSGEEYVNSAVALITDEVYRSSIRARLCAARPKLFNDVEPVQALADFLWNAAGGHAATRPADASRRSPKHNGISTAPVPEKMRMAIALQQQGHLDRALALYEEVLKVRPSDVDALHLSGVIAAANKQPIRALELIDRALAFSPEYALAWCNRGSVLRDLGRFEAALASYDQALALKADYAEAYLQRGKLLSQMGQPEAATASYDRAIALKPESASRLQA